MNKRIKKKRSRQVMICGIINLKNPWNTNTPIWKRIRASGRKRKMYYDIHCFSRQWKYVIVVYFLFLCFFRILLFI